ncbi:MAG: extracellular solute-binding protein, partial [Lachnospiraceae bacterium]|nr:extracellular solute-binding protein [Lachnospiraceae bacterium]
DIEARIVELIPQTFEELLAFANEYDAPAAVDGVFKWDVSDIFYNYFFAGNYMNVGGPCSDTPEEVDIYNLDAIKAMQIYQNLNQFFSFEANDMKYASVIEEFMAGKMVYTTATSDIIKTLDAAKEEGTFAFDYGLMEIPDLNEELQTKNLSVTNTVVVNGFSDGKEDANKFASYLTSKAAESLYEKTGKIPALTKEACKDERTAVFYREYENSVPAPKMMVTSNLWVQLEVTFTEVWNGAGVSRSLQNLSEMIMSQINGADYEEEFIEEPKEEEETVEYLDEEAEREAALQEEE